MIENLTKQMTKVGMREFSAVERIIADHIDDEEERLPQFPLEALPLDLREMATAISEVCGVPPCMSGPMVLAAASASLGRGILLKSIRGHLTPPNLYVLVSKASGSGGSTAFDKAAEPLYARQAIMRREFDDEERPELEARLEWIESSISQTKKELRGAPEIERQQLIRDVADLKRTQSEINSSLAEPLIIASDATSEGMSDLLSKFDECLGHFDSDASDALGNITGGRYNRGHVADSLWLKAFTNEPVTIVRKGGDTIHLDHPCLTLLFVVTGDKASELFAEDRLIGGGLMARFLVCDPKARPQPVTLGAADVARAIGSEVKERYQSVLFRAMDHIRARNADDQIIIGFEEEALRLIAEDHNRYCSNFQGESESAPFDARHTEQAIRIANVLHMFEHVSEWGSANEEVRRRFFSGSVDETTVRSALEIRDWFVLHQRAMLSPRKRATKEKAWGKTVELLRGRGTKGITIRELKAAGVFPNKNEAETIVQDWVEKGDLKAVPRKPSGAGRPTTDFFLAKETRGAG